MQPVQPPSLKTEGRLWCKYIQRMSLWLWRTHIVFFVLKTSHLKKVLWMVSKMYESEIFASTSHKPHLKLTLFYQTITGEMIHKTKLKWRVSFKWHIHVRNDNKTYDPMTDLASFACVQIEIPKGTRHGDEDSIIKMYLQEVCMSRDPASSLQSIKPLTITTQGPWQKGATQGRGAGGNPGPKVSMSY
jgi:hypothetical protein